nr:Chain B, Nitric oxide synthase, inducible [Homo sapiens]6JWN_D Chain D, Nitric oxide synthase, inducible [Homo sapiens]
RGDINNNVE